MDEQYAKSQKRQTLSSRARIVYALISLTITAGLTVLWAVEKGHFELGPILGVCGFKQRFGLPCPGCGWTHAAQRFVTGHPFEAFLIQPAAALFSLIAALTAVFSLLFALFGVDFLLPERIFCSKSSKWLVAAIITVILAGWIVALTRTIFENAQT